MKGESYSLPVLPLLNGLQLLEVGCLAGSVLVSYVESHH